MHELSATEPKPFVILDKLTIRDGWIFYKLYRQDGTMQPMEIIDTLHNRRFVAWVKIHDRYTVHGERDNEQ